ncbi:MAG: hypothetical protein COZ66_01780 [Candidatus Huberarchaeum crystalense]|uniref:Tetratricopeptide repeat protein n=1 Tax=Huberarchaeum crystalense TaxID=2014257 RepID=A0A2H9RCI3_HUBC1|nr:MAG: hypothetical protein COS45_01555 [Candidatus Huberarchaeum crystalense]PIX28020.1 MAG: hypothetical protein COZ66_01780 [Candidatus Huberarchaeum crystalense]PIZ00054.1 MAG: hypothetical protein COY63_00085 [Candidatus Huberarchaeum crystalense]PJC01071.1 MAG: hypothetical protein CO072_02435 [Candidatus Huberarchaeum crystalense]
MRRTEDIVSRIRNFDEIIEIYKKAINKTPNKKDKATYFKLMGFTCLDFYNNLKSAKEAKKYYTKALNLFGEMGDKAGKSACYSGLGKIEYLVSFGTPNLDGLKKAEKYFKLSLEIDVDPASNIHNNVLLGDIYKILGKLNEANNCYRMALKINEKLSEVADNKVKDEKGFINKTSNTSCTL